MDQKSYTDKEAADLTMYSGKHNKEEDQDNAFWSKFEKSGTVYDYLTYSACTKE